MSGGLLAKPYAVEIIWVDAATRNGWKSPEDVEKFTPTIITTRGTIVRRDKEVVVVALSIARDMDLLDLIIIPASCVKKVKRLR